MDSQVPMSQIEIAIAPDHYQSPNNNYWSLQTLINYFETCSKITYPIDNKVKLPFFLGGSVKNGSMKKEDIVLRSLLVYDIDHYPHNYDSLLHTLKNIFDSYKYILFTTVSHTYDKPRVRLILFPNEKIEPDLYKTISTNFLKEFDQSLQLKHEGEYIIDEASHNVAQRMTLPCNKSEIKYNITQGEIVVANYKLPVLPENQILINNSNRELDIDTKSIIKYLKYHDVNTLDYSSWLEVGMALHHQFQGSDKGLKVWTNWSENDTRYQVGEIVSICRSKWQSFSNNNNSKTFASIIHKVRKSVHFKISRLNELSTTEEIKKCLEGIDGELLELCINKIAKVTKRNIRELKNIVNPIETQDNISPLPLHKFIHKNDKKGIPLETIENLEVVLEGYGISVRYNCIKRQNDIIFSKEVLNNHNIRNNSITYIDNLLVINNIKTHRVRLINQLDFIASKNIYNPVKELIENAIWDGKNRFEELCSTVTTNNPMFSLLLRKFLISMIAAAFIIPKSETDKPFHSKGVLIFQGRESIGKTTWFSKLLPFSLHQYFGNGQGLKVDDDDSVLIAITHWLVEIGEFGRLFKNSSVCSTKAFITKDVDVLRRKYAVEPTAYNRHTVFCGTVNPRKFLIDKTGSTRWWVVDVLHIKKHDINILQLFAEVLTWFKNGEKWWLDYEDEVRVEEYNKNFTAVSPMEELLDDVYDTYSSDSERTQLMSNTAILKSLNFHVTTHYQVSEMNILLEARGFQKCSNTRKWKMPAPKFI